MQTYAHPLPDYSSIRDLSHDEKSEIKKNIINGEATAEEKMALRRHTLSKYIDVKNTPNDVLEALWEACERNKNVKPFLHNASLEAGKVTLHELQWADYWKHVFAELADQKRANYEVISALNKTLGLETLFAGNDTPIVREDFPAKVKPILVNKDVQKLFKYKLPKQEEDYIDIINSIYKKWTGKTKVVCHKNKARVNGKYVTPYVLQETTIDKDKIPIKEYIIPLHTTTHLCYKFGNISYHTR